MKYLVFVILIVVSGRCFAQKSNTWDKWQWLVGDWQLLADDRNAQPTGTFSFRPDLAEKIMVHNSHTDYTHLRYQKTVHDAIMLIYPGYSGTPQKIVYFDDQGHSIDYTYTITDKSVIFTSSRTAPGPSFRMSYYKLDSGLISTRFESSTDGTTYQPFMDAKARKVKPADKAK